MTALAVPNPDRWSLLCMAAIALLVTSCAGPIGKAAPTVSAEPTSPYVGHYDGNSFETAMGMEVAPDGTFRWGLSVGSLDLRAAGTWEQKGQFLYLTSDPTPVPPAFRFVSVVPRQADAKDDRLVSVIREDLTPFTYAQARIECANGERITEFVSGSTAYLRGYEPPECDEKIAVAVEQSTYNIVSPRIDLREAGWQPGQIVLFEFARNDLGVSDFTGMIGLLDEGVLYVTGGKGLDGKSPPRPGEVVLEMRKLEPALAE